MRKLLLFTIFIITLLSSMMVGCGSIPSSYTDIWGSSSTDVYVHGYGTSDLHYDGSKWSKIETSYLIKGKFWGTSSSDVFDVGTSNTILHYDGSTWSRMK